MDERNSCQVKEHLLEMVRNDGISKMTIHILVCGAEQLSESVTIDDELKACSPGQWVFSTLVFGSAHGICRYTTIGDRTCDVTFDCNGPLHRR